MELWLLVLVKNWSEMDIKKPLTAMQNIGR